MTTDLRAGLDRGTTLPFDWFANPDVFRLEQDRIFGRTWQYVGVADWVSEPGQFFTARAGLVPVVVVRDHDGRLNGFVNICRHRATEVAQGRGKRETLQCPYHAWTYGLDGCLRAAPRSDREPDFDRSEYGLVPVLVDTWGPMVFVNRDLAAAPLAETLGALPGIVEHHGLRFDDLRFHSRSEWVLEANWKAVAENYLECYHCPTAHPEFSKVIDVDPDAYLLTSDEWFSSQIAPLRNGNGNGNGNVASPYRTDGVIERAQFHFVFPMFTINILPGPGNFSAFVFVPLAPGRTLTISDHFFAEDFAEEEIDEMRAFAERVGNEDRDLVESIQRAAASGGLESGRLLLSSEHLVQHFQRLVERALA
jgi:phenylpropionate dioxygenase-like ring-hydroxylating dioxygenase large terminal subunit